MTELRSAQGLASLNDLFRKGRLPEPPPNGRYRGKLVVLDIAPGLTQLFRWVASLWMPWRGKVFDPSRQLGKNIFTKNSYPLARLFNPLYRGFQNDTPATYQAFAFRTYPAPGLLDADQTVLRIDYNLNENTALTVRRVVDELVQVDDQLYLGKAHVHWWWRAQGAWQTVAFFSLVSEKESFSPQRSSA